MKKFILFLSTIITIFLLYFVTSLAQESFTASLDSVILSEDNTSVVVSITLSDDFILNNEEIFLFSLPPGNNGNIDALVPIAKMNADHPQVQFSVSFDKEDLSAVLNGYLIAISDDNNEYSAISEPVYISNISQLALNTYEYPIVNSKKGLQVQLTADAQLLGIKHTVINAFVNDLLKDNTENSISFIYGGKEYNIDQTALNMLDYRVKTLSDAGIHIYMNILLAFDPSAPENLYYNGAVGNSTAKLYAINVSDSENVKRIAAVMHFLTDRYTRNTKNYGFCGSYIIGYEVNNEAENNSAALSKLEDYAYSYSVLLRAADAAARTAYKNARIYVSVSNQWNISTEKSKSELFGAHEFLTELAEICKDVPFGISVNPYPSDLGMTDFWNDSNAKNHIDTEYITIKNLNVFTEYLKTDLMLFGNNTRRALIGEFGVSGKYGEESEYLQAAAYAYAYYTVCQNDTVEAFIWHRHVDHSGEPGLYYGLYSSGELLLDPQSEKKIHSVISSVDTYENDGSVSADLDALLEFLPIHSWDELLPFLSDSEGFYRKLFNSEAVAFQPNSLTWNSEYLFDFSESVYSFYPSDNSQYLEQYEENGKKFMRVSLLPVAPVEYMGAGCNISDISQLANVRYLGIKVRVISKISTSDFKLLITHSEANVDTVLDCSSTITCGEWTEFFFPIEDDCFSHSTGSGKLKIWVKGNTESENNFYLDIESIKLYSPDISDTARNIFRIILLAAVSTVIILTAVFFLLKQGRKRKK